MDQNMLQLGWSYLLPLCPKPIQSRVFLSLCSSIFSTIATTLDILHHVSAIFTGRPWKNKYDQARHKRTRETIKKVLTSWECVNSLLILTFSDAVNFVHIIKELTSFISSTRSPHHHQGVHIINESTLSMNPHYHQGLDLVHIIIKETTSSRSSKHH